MIAKTYTCSLGGIDANLVEVEVDLASGLPGFSTVGLPELTTTGLLSEAHLIILYLNQNPKGKTRSDRFGQFRFRFLLRKRLFWNTESKAADYRHFDKSDRQGRACQSGSLVSSAMAIVFFSSVKSKLFTT